MWSPSLSPPARGTTYSCSVSFAHFPRLLFTVGGRPPTPPDAASGRESRVFHGPSAHSKAMGSHGRPHTPMRPSAAKAGCSTGLRPTCGGVSGTHGKVYRLCVEIPSDLSALSRQKSVYLDLARRKRRIPSAIDRCTQALAAQVSFPRCRPGAATRNLKRRWIALGRGGPRRRAWTGGSCHCRIWGTGRRRGSPSRTGRR